MISFKQYLVEKPTEWNISWQKHIMELVIYGCEPDRCFFMLHPAMLKKVYGEHQRITAFHATDTIGLERLQKIQNTNKTISVFTSLTDNYHKLLGDKLTGDENYKNQYGEHNTVLVYLEGNLLGGQSSDMSSQPESRGIRGFPMNSVSFASPVVRIVNKLINKYPEAKLKDYDGPVEYPYRINSYTPYSLLQQFYEWMTANHKEEYPKLYAEYYQICLDWLRSNKDYFRETYLHNDVFTAEYAYNELLISHIKIKEILIINQVYHLHSRHYTPVIDEDLFYNIPVYTANSMGEVMSFIADRTFDRT